MRMAGAARVVDASSGYALFTAAPPVDGVRRLKSCHLQDLSGVKTTVLSRSCLRTQVVVARAEGHGLAALRLMSTFVTEEPPEAEIGLRLTVVPVGLRALLHRGRRRAGVATASRLCCRERMPVMTPQCTERSSLGPLACPPEHVPR